MTLPQVQYKTWCYWHHPCQDIDDGKPGTACTAHLHEAHVFACPYSSLADATQGYHQCMDAKPPEPKEKPHAGP